MFMGTSDDGEPSKCGRNRKSKVGRNPGGSFREAFFRHGVGEREAGHAGFHPSETELAVEVLLAGRGVEDDVLARQPGEEGLHDPGAEALPLEFGDDGHFIDGGLVGAVGERPGEADGFAIHIGEHDDRAGRESLLDQLRRPRGHAHAPERVGHERPVHVSTVVFQFHVHAIAVWGPQTRAFRFSPRKPPPLLHRGFSITCGRHGSADGALWRR